MATSSGTNINDTNDILNDIKNALKEILEQQVKEEKERKKEVEERKKEDKGEKKDDEEGLYRRIQKLQNEYKNEYDKKNINSEKLDALAKQIHDLTSENSKWRRDLEYRQKNLTQGLTFDDRINHWKRNFIEKSGGNSEKYYNGLDELKKGVKELVNIGKNLQDSWGKVDQAAFDYTKAIGGNKGKADAVRANAIEQVKDKYLGSRFNVSPQELIKLQEKYNTEIGRSVDLTNSQLENMSAMKSLMGDEKALAFATKFEKFGLDVDTASKAAGEIFSDASERGVSFEEYSKNFLDNIQLAQSYSFENGLKGLSNMARKATELKLNMKEAVSFAEKTNTVEGAIKSAAGLSVLGGSFSMGANPMSMLYDSLNNLEGVEDRITKMIGGMAKWNSDKKMVDISSFNKQRIRAAAEQMGVDPNELINSAMAQGRRRIAQKQINANLDEKTKDLALNKAQIDENGKAYVTINGERRDIDKLENKDYQALKKENQSLNDDVKDIATTLRGWNDVKEGVGKQFEVQKQSLMEWIGLGNIIKQGFAGVGASNFLLSSIFAVTTGIAAMMGGARIVNGVRNMATGLMPGGAIKGTKNIAKTAWGGTKNAVKSLGPKLLKGLRFIKAKGDVPNELPQNISLESPTSVISAKNTAKYKDELSMMEEGTYPKLGNGSVSFAQRRKAIKSVKNYGGTDMLRAARSKTLGGLGKAVKLSAKSSGSIGSGVLSAGIQGYDEFFGENANRDSTSEKIAKTAGAGLGGWGGAAAGAAIGTAILPGIGTAIGMILGSMGGVEAGTWLGGLVGGTTEDKMEVACKNGFVGLRGIATNDYSMDDIRDIIDGNADKDLIETMKDNGDIGLYNSKHGFTFSKGVVGKFSKGGIGIAKGKKHSEGGIKTVIGGEPAEIEDGEAVISAAKTRMYLPELKAMNEGRLPKINIGKHNGYFKEGGIKQSNNNMGSLEVSKPQGGNYNFGAQEISFKPLDINFAGSIDIKGSGQTNSIDIKNLLSNPEFKREIANLIIKEVSTKIHKGNDKEKTFSYQMGRH